MDYTPTIPDDLVEHYLSKSGFQCPDVRLHCKARVSSVQALQQKDKRLISTMDDLLKTLREEYFADSPSAGLDPVTREE